MNHIQKIDLPPNLTVTVIVTSNVSDPNEPDGYYRTEIELSNPQKTKMKFDTPSPAKQGTVIYGGPQSFNTGPNGLSATVAVTWTENPAGPFQPIAHTRARVEPTSRYVDADSHASGADDWDDTIVYFTW